MTTQSNATEPETGERKRFYHDDVPIRRIADAEKFCDCPPYGVLKCNRCARAIPYDRDTPYVEVADCATFGCGGQMMGTEWAGWYNHWRDLARELLESHAELERELDALRELLDGLVEFSDQVIEACEITPLPAHRLYLERARALGETK